MLDSYDLSEDEKKLLNYSKKVYILADILVEKLKEKDIVSLSFKDMTIHEKLRYLDICRDFLCEGILWDMFNGRSKKWSKISQFK